MILGKMMKSVNVSFLIYFVPHGIACFFSVDYHN